MCKNYPVGSAKDSTLVWELAIDIIKDVGLVPSECVL